jgi:hypothetical protein
MKKLTEQEIDDRMVVYEELIAHLEMSIYETDGELNQGKILQKQLIRMRDNFSKQHPPKQTLSD